MTMHAFIAGLPKAELHLHIEGSLEPELMFALARRNNIAIPFDSVEAVRAAYSFTRLQDFLDIYYQGANVLIHQQDFHDLAAAYFDRVARDGVVHAEIMFDPQTHTARGIAFDTVIGGLLSAMEEAEAKHGITSRLIMSFLRHLDEDDAFATLDMARPWLDRIEAVGLDSSELGHPPEKFARVFAAARALGLKSVAHAGEEGPPDYVVQALDLLDIDRLDHGNRSLEDAALTARLARTAMTLTVCPLSNLKLCVVDTMDDHPIDRMLREGLRATINSDDPAYFGGYVADNYIAAAEARSLSRDDLVRLARNSFLGSFLPDDAVAGHLARLDAYAAEVR
ncbi:adenosine deaminase [Sphingomonas sp. SORGH_AS802]|uniref:adenosine deaminase n=1 Tax=unclassified Sphingomonas TaxID=196159 RepID=UPI002857C534|nr:MULTISPECIES: adenosine deaminase [unclassified Sphingomonas]MDR6125579.1 adenosine deaminase [Sphingomonas sp. SORGH_AS_0438]MDR6134194.1 adenosine deaminase [Sphingomonas sp. SORGH_AS_0802]